MTHADHTTRQVQQEKAILVACLLPGNRSDAHDPLGELRSLAETAGAQVIDELMQQRQRPAAATFIGSGKTEELAEMVRATQAQVVIFDNDLSPSQIGNVERITECKVLDRSELILDIFAARAQTNESKLQVELAQLEYTYPRLRAMWSHLERIVGGAPAGIGTRGPGEQQLEIDRRLVQRKKSELKKQILAIQQRKVRQVAQRNRDFFTVGLVGYTNAGKSTLFNTLTDGDAYADDKLFATLSTRTRRWEFGHGDAAMLSDTVGFVRDLPHHLVASFRATLEESIHSDLLLLVLDVTHPRAQQQLEIVIETLDKIGADQQPRVLLLNKVDLLEHNADVLLFEQQHPGCLAISARTGRGLDRVVEYVHRHLRGPIRRLKIALDLSDGKAIHFLENRAEVLSREYESDRLILDLHIGTRQLDQLWASGTAAQILEDGGNDAPDRPIDPAALRRQAPD